MKAGIYDARMDLIKKEIKEPTSEELEEAYGYLNYCLACGKPITFWDIIFFRYIHCIMGNYHKKCFK